MAKNIARFRISRDFLVEVLKLPEGANIVKIFEDNNVHSGDFTFVIEHPDLPEVIPGELIPEIKANIKQSYGYDWDWGLYG